MNIEDRIDLPARSHKGTTGFRTTHIMAREHIQEQSKCGVKFLVDVD